MKKMLVVDGHNLLFRMYYGIPSEIKNSNGRDIRAVIGFTGSLIRLINQYLPDKVLIVFDSEQSTQKKKELSEDYKANRIDYSKVPLENNPFTQLENIFTVLDYLQISYVESKEFEADDYIGSVCEKYKKEYDITIVSTDKDFIQLIDVNVTLLYPRGKLSVLYDWDKVIEKYKITPPEIVDYKSLVGDKSDNIRGISGIGPKTAVLILSSGSLKDLFKLNNGLKEKLYQKIIANRIVLEKNKELILINRNINISELINDIKHSDIKDLKTMDVLRECSIA